MFYQVLSEEYHGQGVSLFLFEFALHAMDSGLEEKRY